MESSKAMELDFEEKQFYLKDQTKQGLPRSLKVKTVPKKAIYHQIIDHDKEKFLQIYSVL